MGWGWVRNGFGLWRVGTGKVNSRVCAAGEDDEWEAGARAWGGDWLGCVYFR